MADILTILDNLLDSHNISGAKMCADLGMSRSFMTELRKGRAKSITMETAHKIAKYFDVPVDYLLGKEEKMPTVSDGQKETPDQPKLTEGEMALLEMFRRFPEAQQNSLILMVEKFEAVPEASRESALEAFQGMLKMLQIL